MSNKRTRAGNRSTPRRYTRNNWERQVSDLLIGIISFMVALAVAVTKTITTQNRVFRTSKIVNPAARLNRTPVAINRNQNETNQLGYEQSEDEHDRYSYDDDYNHWEDNQDYGYSVDEDPFYNDDDNG